MKKKILILAVVLVLIVSSFSLIACNNKKGDYYPAWVYDGTIKTENAVRAEGSNLRIMSFNMLVEAWKGDRFDKPIDARVEQTREMIKYYLPDVVGLQEMCEKWHKLLPAEIADNYTMVFDKSNEYTSMMYNHNTVKLLSSGKERFSTKKSDKRMRYSAWAVFEKIEGGKKFVVINTHFDFGEANKDKQTIQMNEFGTLAKKLGEENNAPVFLTGDYNAYDVECTDKENKEIYEYWQGVELYEKFRDDFADTFKDTNKADPSEIEYIDGSHRKWNEPKWDHIFVSNSVKVLRYAVLSNDYYYTMSDHFPIYVDVAI